MKSGTIYSDLGRPVDVDDVPRTSESGRGEGHERRNGDLEVKGWVAETPIKLRLNLVLDQTDQFDAKGRASNIWCVART